MQEFQSLNPCCLLSPVPAVLVGTRGTGAEDAPNLLTAAWVGTVCSEPPMLSVSIRPSRYSHELILASGELTINLPAAKQAELVDFCGVRSGREVDKFAACHLTPLSVPELDYAPGVAECPAFLSCKVKERIPLGSHDLFLCEIVGTHVQQRLLDEQGALHLERAELLSYTHGVYQRAEGALGFFGYSVARPEVRARRMEALQR